MTAHRLLLFLSFALTSHALAVPHVGYVYPAGGQQDTSFEVIIGGQGLVDPESVLFSGEGVQAQILEHIKPLGAIQASDMRDKLRDMQTKLTALRAAPDFKPTDELPAIRKVMREAEVTERNLLQLADYDRRRNDPKQQQNTQIGELVRVKVTIAEGAEPGLRYCRLSTANGLSNPLRFVVGQHLEIREIEEPPSFDFDHYTAGKAYKHRSRKDIPVTPVPSMPVTINGRILPGELDEFSIQAKKDDQLVLAVQARNITPYLADAVPGWFQAVVSMTNAAGDEVAYADDYHFDPDPVLFYKIPADGEYRIKVNDSIYRGREDFVYRITIGQLPFLTGITPLGAQAGSTTDISFMGGNLGAEAKRRYTAPDQPGNVSLFATVGPWRSNLIPFQIDSVHEQPEREPNDRPGAANVLDPPMVVNGRIEKQGDADYYRLKGRGNQPFVFEVFARRLGSPMDANLTVLDIDGNQIGYNDDYEDHAAGLTTHHADSRLSIKLPPSGECFVRVADTQNQYGAGHAYRLKVTQARPSFALRVTPSSLNAPAGGSARLTVHALRADGFDAAISLSVKGPEGFELKGATIPAGEDKAEISLSVPSSPLEKPVEIHIQGSGQMPDQDPVTAEAKPAEDMMQAFIYRHLVPVDALLVDVRAPAPPKQTAK
ncbi:MAG: hypothetical protein KDK97_16300 [Verrucomicrobiales bacterium]|nr:hypothetical protein [Verrucomicrobiales bacterium]MCP5557317.1 peptidase [Verrucomicrobiaceae bacterium]